MALILAGDIGATHARLGLFEFHRGLLRAVAARTCPSRARSGLGEIVARFVAESGRRVSAAGFGVAGPARAGRLEVTDLA
jgi:glucokinase